MSALSRGRSQSVMRSEKAQKRKSTWQDGPSGDFWQCTSFLELGQKPRFRSRLSEYKSYINILKLSQLKIINESFFPCFFVFFLFYYSKFKIHHNRGKLKMKIIAKISKWNIWKKKNNSKEIVRKTRRWSFPDRNSIIFYIQYDLFKKWNRNYFKMNVSVIFFCILEFDK